MNKLLILLLISVFSCCGTCKATELAIVTEQLPPFQFQQKDQVVGFSTDIIKSALAHTPYRYDIKIFPWQRAYNLAQKKANTCIYSIVYTEARKNTFRWTRPITQTTLFFIGLSHRNIQINSVDDAKKYKVAVLKDDIAEQLLLAAGFREGHNLVVVNNSSSFIKLLHTRQSIDLILTDEYTLNFRARYNHIEPAEFQAFYQFNQQPLDFYLACSPDTDSNIIDSLSSAIETIKQNGEYQKITEKWHDGQQYSQLGEQAP